MVASGLYGGYIYTGYDRALVIDLASFEATPTQSSILLRWETGFEKDNVGFHLWRSDAQDTDCSRITVSLIPSVADPYMGSGAAYSFEDFDVTVGATYLYKLEDIDRDGISTFHGPVSATVGAITLISPDDGALIKAAHPPVFAWESVPYERFRIEFSKRRDFGSGVISLPTSSRKASVSSRWITDLSFTQTRAEWNKVRRLAGQSKAVYWRVYGEDASGNSLRSGAGKLRVR